MEDIELIIDKAINRFYHAAINLKSLAKSNPDRFPASTFGIGSIAECYSLIYLRSIHKNAEMHFGAGNQKGWDIVVKEKGSEIRYQIKSTDGNFDARTVKLNSRNFDRLIVLMLGEYYVPLRAYVFLDAKKLAGKKDLIIPCPFNSRRFGSEVFKHHGIDVLDGFLKSLE